MWTTETFHEICSYKLLMKSHFKAQNEYYFNCSQLKLNETNISSSFNILRLKPDETL